MKNVFKITAIFLLLGSASIVAAEVYECENNTQKYLVALKEKGGGTLYNAKDGNYRDMDGELKYAMPEDGGAIQVNFTATQEEIDWMLPANRKRCVVWGNPSVNLRIKVSSEGDNGSAVTLSAGQISNPNWPKNKPCSFPNPIIQPQAIGCRLL